MPRPHLTRRGINRLPPGVRLVVLAILLIGGVLGAWLQAEPSQPVPTPRPVPGQAILAGVASVIDGDTLDLHGQRIRLHGIDAPESRQTCQRDSESWRCGQTAALALADHIGRQPIHCEQRDVDRYKRVVAVCRLGGADINDWLVRRGWAMAYRQYSKDYVAAEAAAKAAKVGIWAGTVEPPWEWRRRPKG